VTVVLAVLAHTQADPDLWGHIRFGRDIIESRAIPSLDPYSFTSDRAWVNHEWLAECVMYLAYAAGGPPGLVVLKMTLVGMMLAGVVVALRRFETRGRLDVLLGTVTILTLPQSINLRPQLFSMALFSWLLALLLSAGRSRRPLAVLAAVPVLILWVNAHGGWIIGIGTLGLWSGFGLLTDRPLREKGLTLLAALGAIVGTLANPYGWLLWSFLGETVRFGRVGITEWQPIFRAPTPIVPVLWAVVAILGLRAVVRSARARSLDLQSVAVVVAWGAASFAVTRLLAFFAIATVILLGSNLFAPTTPASEPRQARPDPRLVVLGATAAAVLVMAGSLFQAVSSARCIRIDSSVFPEPGAVRWALDRRLRGNMLTWFNWGEYTIWYLAPGIKVSMDGRRETVYSADTIQRYEQLFDSRVSDRREILQSLQPDYIWLPRGLELTKFLQSEGWVPLFSGSRSAVLGRGPATEAIQDTSAPPARCFPGP
jgi:hypothetical protein